MICPDVATIRYREQQSGIFPSKRYPLLVCSLFQARQRRHLPYIFNTMNSKREKQKNIFAIMYDFYVPVVCEKKKNKSSTYKRMCESIKFICIPSTVFLSLL
jgi:hypothetical protein